MRLHELVSLRNELEQSINLESIAAELAKNYQRLCDLSKNNIFTDDILNLAKNHMSINNQLTSNVQELDQVLYKINQEIIEKTRHFFNENYQKQWIRRVIEI